MSSESRFSSFGIIFLFMQLCDNEIDIDPTVCIKNKIKAFISWVNMHMEVLFKVQLSRIKLSQISFILGK